ncbi:hypothetical protein P7K49_018423 [Saguinus oedipus]|uniref:Uncharacterized protein n=1 Tax=Saguinus oedipus TaxID=9490 RepID=A0ABQ9V5B3_SAGOE|nr:hypothetical protein P7K49_018423 [Saguinus oedipus]
MVEQTYSWAYSLVDSSQVSTFLISILLIVYGSFRSLNMDFENQDKEKDSDSSSESFNGNSANNTLAMGLSYIFNSNVMVKVATQQPDNPLDVLFRKLHLGTNVGHDVPRLSLPGKLVFPSSTGSDFSMLGIGDIVMTGLLFCFVLRYDNYRKQASGDSCGAPGPAKISGRMQKVSYFHCTLIGRILPTQVETIRGPKSLI